MPEQQQNRVVEHVSAVIPTPLPDGGVSLSRIDATIIGPRSIARPAFIVSTSGIPITDPDDEFDTGCSDDCPDDCQADHRGEQ